MFSIDTISHLVHTDVSVALPELESRLAGKGFTLNYFTPPNNEFHLGEALEKRLPNLYAAAFGGIDDLCVQVQWRQNGRTLANVLAPRSATGPSLKKMLIGSGDTWGRPIQAVLKIYKIPAVTCLYVAAFPSADRAEAYRANLMRLRLALPLLAQLPPGKIPVQLTEPSVDQVCLGLAFWGEAHLTAAMTDILRELAEGRRGNWMKIEGEEASQKILGALREVAASDLQGALALEEIGFHEDHERLLRKLSR